MTDDHLAGLLRRSEQSAYARLLGIRVISVASGTSEVELTDTGACTNLMGMVHGGALFSLMDEAFALACNSYGEVAVALNVAITYVRPAPVAGPLRATAEEISRSRRIGTYRMVVRAPTGELVATAQGIAYRTRRPLAEASSGDAQSSRRD